MLQKIRFRFDTHGLGDCCHCATVLQLYRERGYDVAIQVETNKRWMWQACGIPIYDGPDQLPLHPYHYPGDFHELEAPDHSASKIAHLVLGVDDTVLPRLGTPEEVWRMISEARPNVISTISGKAHAIADRFIKGLPRPIFAVHSRGTNWSSEKSIPDGIAFETIMLLLKQTEGSVIVLDFDARAPSVAGHPRCRPILPTGEITDLDRLAALFTKIDLLIGIDSGPFHFAGMVPTLKTLGVFRQIPAPRCCIPSPMATYLVPARDHVHWQCRLDESINIPAHDDTAIPAPHFNFIEYPNDEPTAQDIVTTAVECLLPPVPGTTDQEPVESAAGNWLYRRMGHDERRLELLANGNIVAGGADCERQWRLTGDALRIYGDALSETCRLKRGPDGIYRGRWHHHEQMPIELIPIRDICHKHDLHNGDQIIWNPASAAESFAGYVDGWDLAVGTRGNGSAWLLDRQVERCNLDSPGIDDHGHMIPYVDHEDWIFQHLDVPAGCVVLDFASFIGTNAVWWAHRGVRVIGCEPLPITRTLLHRNLQLNQVTDLVTIVPKAFGASAGSARMMSHLHSASTVGSKGDVEVEVTTIDSEILPHLQRLDLIKLDVEGAECDVIEGAKETLRRFHPKLVIEVHGHLQGRTDNRTILERLLTQLGYEWREIWRNSADYYYVSAVWQG